MGIGRFLILFSALTAISAQAADHCADAYARQAAFFAGRANSSFGSLEEFEQAAGSWDDEFWKTISAKEKVKPKSLNYTVPAPIRLRYTQHAYIGRNHFLAELDRLRLQSAGFDRDVSADSAVTELVENVFQRFGTIEAAAKEQNKAANQIRKDLKQFKEASGLPSIKVKEVGDAIQDYFQRIEDLKKVYGDEFLTDHTVKDAAFNAIGANIFTNIAELPLHNKKALDAIALLDPLTDDALDRGLPVMQSMKKITKILDGEPQAAENSYEKIVFGLIDDIFKAHPRDTDPDVVNALRMIHKVQLSSIKAQKNPAIATEELAKITARKGGLSVWLAAKLAIGKLSKEESEYFYKLGANAQILDDLVDYGDDLASGTMTLWTHATKSGKSLKEPYNMLMRSQNMLEQQAPQLLSRMPHAADIQKSANLGTKLYLMGALTQDDVGKMINPFLKDKFPVSRENLKKVVLASMKEMDIPGDDRLKVLEIIDKSIFNEMYGKFKLAENKTPEQILSGLTGPEPYWTMYKNWVGFKRWNIDLMRDPKRQGARDFYMLFWASSSLLSPFFMESQPATLAYIAGMLVAYNTKNPQLALATWSAGISYAAYQQFLATDDPRKRTGPSYRQFIRNRDYHSLDDFDENGRLKPGR